MPEIVSDCPRCGAGAITFDVLGAHNVRLKYNWQRVFEAFGVCRRCSRATVLIIEQHDINDAEFLRRNHPRGIDNLNTYFRPNGYVSVANFNSRTAPEHTPEEIANIFGEGSKCLAVGCHNAAAAMFRLVADLATKGMLPEENGEAGGPNRRVKKYLADRIDYLIESGEISARLTDILGCIREFGNDGAHDGDVQQEDAADLEGFTFILLEEVFTLPGQVQAASERRAARKAKRAPDVAP